MDKRAVDAGDIQFFELAYLETEVKNTKIGFQIELTDFVIPNLDLIPEEVKKLIKKWSDYIDYWSVDWDYKDDTFHNQWQSYRTKKDRSLELITDPKQYEKKGDYKVMVKVIDIFGNDTTHIIELKHR
jgi:adenine specific DNA methylase Mod